MEQDECCVCYENVKPISRHTVMDFKCQFCNDGILCSDCKCKIVNEDIVICPICRSADFRDVKVMIHESIRDLSWDDENVICPPVFKKVYQTLDLYPTDEYLENQHLVIVLLRKL